MINRLHKLALINTAATPMDVVVLSNYLTGVTGAAAFFYKNQEQEATIEDGDTIIDQVAHTIDGRFLTPSSSEQTLIDSWIANKTPIRVAAIGIDGGIVAEDDAYIVSARKLDSERE